MTLTTTAVVAVAATLVAVTQAGSTPSPSPSPRPERPPYNGTGPTMLRFGCHQLVIDRIDPLVNPGAIPSPHQHQIVGGDAFNASMRLSDISASSSCTTCSYSDDFSNYWTSNLYFGARNGSYKRVPQIPNHTDWDGLDEFTPRTNGGLVAYYVSPGKSEVTAFKPGFRMFVGDAALRSAPQGRWNLSSQTCFRCYSGPDFGGDRLPPCWDPAVDTQHLPDRPCYGIRSNVVFPTCWDGKNLDSADHKSHVAYPVEGPHVFDGINTAKECPPSHPVKIPQVMVEIIYDTTVFNDPSEWPEDGSQPFVLSTGDRSGYSQHADYVFGWKGDALQRGMDAGCIAAHCPGLATQTVEEATRCKVRELVDEKYEGWLDTLPGDPPQPPVTASSALTPCPTTPRGKGNGKGKREGKGKAEGNGKG
ncbi:hypothetical protein C8A01DRAFT_16172 [Parachaetomium inaequale]|uniref:DUF1996 domain-containing protein n=1 Tax=Parachaetomium inaequale TaxID=2588326 RepID=A0AAN6PFE2_9PEZI|nr:hypothetical protein C8A01DRAFT_16172 [Parachaetomium inaequale]